MADGHLDVLLPDGGDGFADTLHPFHLEFRRALEGALIQRQRLHMGLQDVNLVLPGFLGAGDVRGVEAFRAEPDGGLAHRDGMGFIQDDDPCVNELLGPIRVGGNRGMRLGGIQGRIAVPGQEQHRRALGQLGEKIQHGLNIAAGADHIARQHHCPIPGAAADGLLHRGLPVPQLCAVQVGQVEEVVQIGGQIGDGDIFAGIGNGVGHGEVGGE